MQIKCQREKLNLLGYFLEKIVANNCEISKKIEDLRQYHGKILIIGSKMSVLLFIENAIITIMPYDQTKVDATVKASLGTFLRIALGDSMVLAFLKGQIRVRGNLIKLLPLLKLLRLSA